jgi:hypothetical protein
VGSVTEYAICFDFPEGGDPWFAGLVGNVFGLVSNLADALTFESETAADVRALANATYGDGTRPHGAVVESRNRRETARRVGQGRGYPVPSGLGLVERGEPGTTRGGRVGPAI